MAKTKLEAPANAVSSSYMKSADIQHTYPIKSKAVACVLSFFLGAFGVHQFYLKHTAKGITILILTVLLSAVYIAITSIVKIDTTNWFIVFFVYELIFVIRGIVYLFSSDKSFRSHNKVRTF